MSVELLTTIPAAKDSHAAYNLERHRVRTLWELNDFMVRHHAFAVTAVIDGSERHTLDGLDPKSHHTDDSFMAAERLTHPNPEVRRRIALELRVRRQIAYRMAQIHGTVKALDFDNVLHARWFAHLVDFMFFHPTYSLYTRHVEDGIYISLGAFMNTHPATNEGYPMNSIFDPRIPFTTPTGIPEVEVPAEAIEYYGLAPTKWDVQQAAMYELEIGMGGIANIILHDQLSSSTDKNNRLKTRSRVETYLDINLVRIPEDPWDPNYWGHDARLSSLALQDHVNQPIVLTPAFDMDVYAYTTSTPIAPPTSINAVASDPFASITTAFSNSNSVLTVTCTAKDGETVLNYVIRAVVPD